MLLESRGQRLSNRCRPDHADLLHASIIDPMAVRDVLRSSVVFDWTQLEPAASARCTVGVAVPLAVGLILRQPWIGAFGVIGAVSVGFGSFQGAYRSRAAVMIYASAGMAGAGVLGAVGARDALPRGRPGPRLRVPPRHLLRPRARRAL